MIANFFIAITLFNVSLSCMTAECFNKKMNEISIIIGEEINCHAEPGEITTTCKEENLNQLIEYYEKNINPALKSFINEI